MGNSSGGLADLVDDQHDLVLQAELFFLRNVPCLLVSSFESDAGRRVERHSAPDGASFDNEFGHSRRMNDDGKTKKKDAKSTEEDLELKGYQDLCREVGIPLK